MGWSDPVIPAEDLVEDPAIGKSKLPEPAGGIQENS